MKLVLCDDHRLLIEAMELVLGGLGHEVCALTITPDEALAAVAEHQPDVCILDVTFPGSTSLDVIPRMLEISPGTRVVLLSGDASDSVVARAIALGAAGFVRKERMMQELVEALDLVCAGHLAVDPMTLQRALRSETTNEGLDWLLSFLTDREWQVLRCILDGLSTEEMAVTLDVRRSTARTHVQNVLTKLGAHSRLQVAALVSSHGSDLVWPAHVR